MVVGGVTVDGDRWYKSCVDVPGNPKVIKLYAPSSDINVPAPDGSWRNFHEVTGVSYGRQSNLFISHASMNNILTPAMIAAATVSGLAAYFLGLSSLSDLLITDDPVERVKNLKDFLEVGSAVRRGKDDLYDSVWNDQDPETCLPGTPPPGFQNGDGVPCADATTSSGNTVVAIPNCFITTQVYYPYPNPSSIRHSNTIHLQRSSDS